MDTTAPSEVNKPNPRKKLLLIVTAVLVVIAFAYRPLLVSAFAPL